MEMLRLRCAALSMTSFLAGAQTNGSFRKLLSRDAIDRVSKSLSETKVDGHPMACHPEQSAAASREPVQVGGDEITELLARKESEA